MTQSNGRWPNGCSAAVSVTLDNMGEAAELYRGTWPTERALGEHFSVTDALPRILDILDEYDIRTTYFIEGWNTGMYRSAIQEVQRRGHEVGFHGWQHENWASLNRHDEDRSISRNRGAFWNIGVDIRGFRPPGGLMTDATPQLLRAAGFSHCSPAGGAAALIDGIAILPFEWRAIDAYHYSEAFAPLRRIYGDAEEPLSPTRFVDQVMRIVNHRLESGGYVAVLFHPFLEHDRQRVKAMREILSTLAGNADIWCAPCQEVARWVLDHADRFTGDPALDRTTWTRS